MLHLEKKCVLYLNAQWLPINMVSIKDAIIAMTGGIKTRPAKGFNIEYERDDNGDVLHKDNGLRKIEWYYPISWDEWLKLPIREDVDQVIHSQHIRIRVPTVIITEDFAKMPTFTPRPTKTELYNRQKGKCFFTDQDISMREASIEHLTPKSKGGKDAWENLVITEKHENWKKGDLTLQEYESIVGRKFTRPKPMAKRPRMANIKPCHEDHYMFFSSEAGQ